MISAIIPAYNEENTIADVLSAVKKVKDIHEIIVVSDGSEDRTASIAREYGVKVVELSENLGKGAAVKAGLEKCSGSIILFLDADLVGINDKHIKRMIEPIVNSDTDMVIGVFSNGRLSTDLAQKISPFLSGQRVVRKYILDDIKGLDTAGYGIEMALTRYTKERNIKVKEVMLEDLTHVMKEEKYGLLKGFGHRLRMYWQIYKGMRLVKR